MIRRPAAPTGEWHQCRVGGGVVKFTISGRGEPVILLHGLSGSVRWWQRNIPDLSRRFRVFAVDLLRYRPDAGRLDFSFEEAALYLRDWMDVVGIPSTHIIGHSMGGAIAAQLAADFPERVKKLVLVNAAALFPASRLRLSPTHLLRKAPRFPITLVPVVIQDAWRTGPRILWSATRDLLSSDLRPKLPQIRSETLIVWGVHDGVLPLSLGQELASLLPTSRLLVLPRAGHNPMWEQPVEFNRAVSDFLRSCADGP